MSGNRRLRITHAVSAQRVGERFGKARHRRGLALGQCRVGAGDATLTPQLSLQGSGCSSCRVKVRHECTVTPRCTWQGGSLFGFDLRPGPYSREVVFLYRLQSGRITDRWAVRDDLTMLRQLVAL